MKGTTLECFEDLVRRMKPDLAEKRRILAQFLRLKDTSIKSWEVGAGSPVGMSLIGLRFYLDFIGYTVTEVTSLRECIQDAARLLAFRVITLEEMAKLTAFEKYPDKILAVLRGVRGISPESESLFREVVESYRPELEEAMRSAPRLIQLDLSDKHESHTAVKADVTRSLQRSIDVLSAPVRRPGPSREELLRGLVINLLESSRYYFEPSVSEKEREKMRDIVGQDNIFELKNMLSRLCSSKAFNNR